MEQQGVRGRRLTHSLVPRNTSHVKGIWGSTQHHPHSPLCAYTVQHTEQKPRICAPTCDSCCPDSHPCSELPQLHCLPCGCTHCVALLMITGHRRKHVVCVPGTVLIPLATPKFAPWLARQEQEHSVQVLLHQNQEVPRHPSPCSQQQSARTEGSDPQTRKTQHIRCGVTGAT